MRKFFQLVAMIIIGIIVSIVAVLVGIVLCISIVGIPKAKKCFGLPHKYFLITKLMYSRSFSKLMLQALSDDMMQTMMSDMELFNKRMSDSTAQDTPLDSMTNMSTHSRVIDIDDASHSVSIHEVPDSPTSQEV